MRVLVYIKIVQEKDWCIGNMDMYTFLGTLIQDMLVIERVGSLLLATAPLLKRIW